MRCAVGRFSNVCDSEPHMCPALHMRVLEQRSSLYGKHGVAHLIRILTAWLNTILEIFSQPFGHPEGIPIRCQFGSIHKPELIGMKNWINLYS